MMMMMQPFRNWMKLCEAVPTEDAAFDDDYGDQGDTDPIKSAKPIPMPYLRALEKHRARQDRAAWRAKQRRRFRDEADIADNYDGALTKTRHLPKSQIGYNPFQQPLIRFGKFRTVSQVFLNPEADETLGQGQDYPNYEEGVSCFAGYPWKDGFQVLEPQTNRAVYNNNEPFGIILHGFRKQLIDYLDRKVPMDIFLIHGHLKSFGRNNEWLSLGSDGEYLLDTTKPYHSGTLLPEQVYMTERLNLIQWFDASLYGGITRLRDDLRADEARS